MPRCRAEMNVSGSLAKSGRNGRELAQAQQGLNRGIDFSLVKRSGYVERVVSGPKKRSSGACLRLGEMLSDVGGLPEKCRVLADAFDNGGLLGKQEFRLISAGSHRIEVGGLAVMVQHGRE